MRRAIPRQQRPDVPPPPGPRRKLRAGRLEANRRLRRYLAWVAGTRRTENAAAPKRATAASPSFPGAWRLALSLHLTLAVALPVAVKIVTWNINSLNMRLGRLVDWLKANDPDVVCLQEMKLEDGRFPHDEAGKDLFVVGLPATRIPQEFFGGDRLSVRHVEADDSAAAWLAAGSFWLRVRSQLLRNSGSNPSS